MSPLYSITDLILMIVSASAFELQIIIDQVMDEHLNYTKSELTVIQEAITKRRKTLEELSGK